MLNILIIGSTVIATTYAKIICNNVLKNDKFNKIVNIYIDDGELFNDKKLKDIINQEHENLKYLPGQKLPDNLVAVNDLESSARNADIIFFAMKHELLKSTCEFLVDKIKSTAFSGSFLKGFYVNDNGEVDLLTKMVKNILNIDCYILAGPTIPLEVSLENYSETTIATKNYKNGLLLKELIETPYLVVYISENVEVVEACCSLKDIVALATGLIEGLGVSENTRAAIIRLGLMEIIKFCEIFYPKHDIKIFLQSFSLSNLISTCNGGQNHALAIDFVQKHMDTFKEELPNGVRLHGFETAKYINQLLKLNNIENKFPLFTSVYKICSNQLPVDKFISQLIDHPVYTQY